eukprot:7129215-Prorocentrum_lima.AAC.1
MLVLQALLELVIPGSCGAIRLCVGGLLASWLSAAARTHGAGGDVSVPEGRGRQGGDYVQEDRKVH